jgi:hypothetical protein
LAAGLCAASYAFGGNVLFQYCNVVYLVGAAWLPAALLAADRMLVDRRIGAALVLGMILALMVLGGDPQMAYNTMLLVALYAALLWTDRKRGSSRLGIGRPQRDISRRSLRSHRVSLLAVAACTALVLSAIQVFPSWQWTGRCQRAAYQAPRSILEVAAHLTRENSPDSGQEAVQGIFGAPASGTHHEHIYHFSVGPWRLAELLWPNVSGRMFPVNRRWTNAIPAEGRVWTPSLYAGILPLFLGLSVWRLRGGECPIRWASWMALLATLGALGWYGFGWLLQELRVGLLGREVDDLFMGQPVGGLYWLMVVTLPGYALFRFPAKLMVVFSLGLGLLAARGFDRLSEKDPKLSRRYLLALITISFALLLVFLSVGTYWTDWTGSTPADALFGPYDADGALADLRVSLLHTVVVGGIIWWLLSRLNARNRQWIWAALLLVTAVDLAVANRWMVLTAPQNLWRDESVCESEIAEHARTAGDGRPMRVLRGARLSWWPNHWTEVSADDRHEQGLRWDRNTRSPKFHLLGGLELVESFGSCTSSDYSTFLNVARRYGPRRPDKAAEVHPGIVNLLGARYLILPSDFDYAHTQPLSSAGYRPMPDNTVLRFNPRAYPRAWIVHDVTVLPPLKVKDPVAVDRRTRQVLFPNDKPLDFLTVAVVETSDEIDVFDGGEEKATVAAGVRGERCHVVTDAPERMQVRAELQSPGLLVVSDTYYPGWVAEVRSGDGPAVAAPILRTNRIMRGVLLPPGDHDIVFSYDPTPFYVGAAISASGWLALLVGFAAASWKKLTGRFTAGERGT